MLTIQPAKRIQGETQVPGDKSISHRAVMFGALAEGTTRISGFLQGADCLSTIECFSRMGVSIEREGDHVTVHGKGWFGLQEPNQKLDVGNSGTTIRLMSGILATQPFHCVVEGDESIAKRPMRRVIGPLREMGAKIDGRKNGEFTPLSIRGGDLKGITYVSPVASAQIKSAILLAGLQADGTTIVEEPSVSRDHTERMLRAFGVEVGQSGKSVSVQGGQKLIGREISVPGDISSAAFLIAAVMMLPESELLITNVGINPTRTGIIDVVRAMGGTIELRNERIVNEEPVADIYVAYTKLHGTVIEGDLIPRLIDEIPVIAVMATQAVGETIIRDAAELKVKETDRIATVVSQLGKFGAKVQPTDDGMIITGECVLHGTEINSMGDHRIGMAMAIAGLASQGETIVRQAEAIDVSFPGFANLLASICQR
ncbi:3-phosphoshikimate 1-carboxyvinyltransferase [Brevibacillus laterosporus]|uniref:3-phosphoshikimate 1-carboxyvinyltransferase n=1 Tax=Brevibacillus laterosporus TaxID=1465 RepID=UPI00035F8003|nr:3-phosphoshikimate 1-carboxyvinyltransferase [Brevibacillus laterosporus]ATO51212.1 3-phosphoshikimate 1-carboxyvinyltransferase [Brevibacillus laterosporus DSM 25]AYB38646.1 3-phosphoshikimate 1-carboxyvinyltransferase [Brevibacillus laterosporus]MBG9771982.1 3-phosphoshikimate 1-carboxyvinyltransferase [Brevibacillus laterosporus]MBG9804148.1 3-phosphoshikimate 1-carboxyvinyltransferase [Brevibacillus laterosporus]MBM7108926.1 3-phosphoshikimate 1-carboxyvinyltransferase 1 [Brevibacillus 